MKKIHFTFIRVLLAALVVAGLYTGYRVCSPTYPQAVPTPRSIMTVPVKPTS